MHEPVFLLFCGSFEIILDECNYNSWTLLRLNCTTAINWVIKWQGWEGHPFSLTTLVTELLIVPSYVAVQKILYLLLHILSFFYVLYWEINVLPLGLWLQSIFISIQLLCQLFKLHILSPNCAVLVMHSSIHLSIHLLAAFSLTVSWGGQPYINCQICSSKHLLDE